MVFLSAILAEAVYLQQESAPSVHTHPTLTSTHSCLFCDFAPRPFYMEDLTLSADKRWPYMVKGFSQIYLDVVRWEKHSLPGLQKWSGPKIGQKASSPDHPTNPTTDHATPWSTSIPISPGQFCSCLARVS
ncbi:hypothetical protein KP509_26G023500 [Ceratopteris richardii]|uniref:Uncharacterized protein n=1 Tax=Ceratopteris richardii TaxID=49495 RepID=A0A8T2RL93_CERRI|nr:hypothetical protein KP509_26G023500 [Ceratopteris richardii]